MAHTKLVKKAISKLPIKPSHFSNKPKLLTDMQSLHIGKSSHSLENQIDISSYGQPGTLK